jgi:hypothetical protein
MNAPLALPQPLDFVSAVEVEQRIMREHEQLEQLRDEVRMLRTKATELHARLEQDQVDPKASTWMALKLRAFLLGLRTEVASECDAHLTWAEAEAERIRRGARPHLGVSFFGAIESPSGVWFDIDLPALEVASQQCIRWSAADHPPVIRSASVTAKLVPEPASDLAPAPVGEARPVEPFAFAEPVAPTVVDAMPPMPLPAPDVEPQSAPLDDADGREFWSDDETVRRSWFRRAKLTRSTVLQVCAGVVAALAIVVHFA